MTEGSFRFRHDQPFHPETATEVLRSLPEADGVCALFGHPLADGTEAQPYLTRTTNLRRRAARLLDAPDSLSKRLNLRDRVARIAWTVTGSEFESLLTLYNAATSLFGPAEARRRLKLHTPTFLRLNLSHAHPRVYTTNRISRARLGELFGPFPSRLAADRYADAILDLFHLRRCHEDLEVHPDHPGCAYGEMRRCLAPCNTTCSAEDYTAEATAVRAFLDTHGESLLSAIAAEREQASEDMDFERAADLHTRWEKVKAAAALADELVRPIPDLRALVAQPATASPDQHAEVACLFLLHSGVLLGPEPLSTLGVRAVREQTSVGSSLFAQPLMLQAVPLDSPDTASTPTVNSASPEARAEAVLATLDAQSHSTDFDPAILSDHLSLFRRWYYRPEKQRQGEVVLPSPDGSWPIRKLLRSAARAVLGDPKPMQPTDREGAKAVRTRVLHPGREGVERTVSVLDAQPEVPPTFRTRRKAAGRQSVTSAEPEQGPGGNVRPA